MKIHAKVQGGFLLECTEQELYHLVGLDYPPPKDGDGPALGDEINVVAMYQRMKALEAGIARVDEARAALVSLSEDIEGAVEPFTPGAEPIKTE